MITIKERLNQNWNDYNNNKVYVGKQGRVCLFVISRSSFDNGDEINVFENPMVVIPFKTVYDYMTNTTTTKNIDMNNEVMQCVLIWLGEILTGTSEDELEQFIPEILERTGLKEWNDPRDLEILGENLKISMSH
jgi:hypothetical protein